MGQPSYKQPPKQRELKQAFAPGCERPKHWGPVLGFAHGVSPPATAAEVLQWHGGSSTWLVVWNTLSGGVVPSYVPLLSKSRWEKLPLKPLSPLVLTSAFQVALSRELIQRFVWLRINCMTGWEFKKPSKKACVHRGAESLVCASVLLSVMAAGGGWVHLMCSCVGTTGSDAGSGGTYLWTVELKEIHVSLGLLRGSQHCFFCHLELNRKWNACSVSNILPLPPSLPNSTGFCIRSIIFCKTVHWFPYCSLFPVTWK